MADTLWKNHHYPPEGMEDAVQTVITQCELWADNVDFSKDSKKDYSFESARMAAYKYAPDEEYGMVAEEVE